MKLSPYFAGHGASCFFALTVVVAANVGALKTFGDTATTNVPSLQPPAVTNATIPVASTPANSASTATASEDWTVNGKDYHNVTVGQVESDRVHITYDGGIGTIMLADLPPELKKRFNYDPVAAKEMTAERQQQMAASDAMVTQVQAQQKEQAQHDEEQAQQNAHEQEAKKNIVFVAGKVLQKVEGGVILSGYEEGEPYPWGDVPHGMQAYSQFDRVFIKGYGGEGVDGAVVEVTAYRSGTFSYTTVLGASSTIVAFTPVSQKGN